MSELKYKEGDTFLVPRVYTRYGVGGSAAVIVEVDAECDVYPYLVKCNRAVSGDSIKLWLSENTLSSWIKTLPPIETEEPKANLTVIDISVEEWREYESEDGQIYRIDDPVEVHISKSGSHRVKDSSGVYHYIPRDKGQFQIIRWKGGIVA